MFFNWFKRSSSVFQVWESWMIHLATISGFSIVALSVIYYLYRITPTTIGLVLSFAFVAGWATFPCLKGTREQKEPPSRSALYCAFGSVASSFLVLAILWISRTDQAIASPWQVVPWMIFILYAFSCACTIRVSRNASISRSIPILMIFGLATFGVSLILYKLGFGYDPFVHQATEQHILDHGVILPKQPMYLGQYVSVVSLSWISQLSIHRVDRLLVPILSTFVMIPMLVTAFRHGWMKQTGNAAIAVLAIFLIPVGYFAFTVPFNLALISLVLIIAFYPLAEDRRIAWFIASLGCVALAIHPLIGIPTCLLAMSAVFRKIPDWLLVIFVPAGLFVAFTIYLYSQGAGMMMPFGEQTLVVLKALFGNPYNLGNGPPYLAILYALLYLAPVLLIGISIYGYTEALPNDRNFRKSVWALGYASIGLLVSAMIIPMFFNIPNILATEQFEFSLRLLLILPLLWLPGLAYAVHTGLNQKSTVKRVTILIVLALALTGSWIASYPQFNEIANTSAPGLSRGDLDAVEFIEGNAKGPYVVLSSQMMGAAALMDFGFEKTVPTREGRLYAYAIPTGGTLYQYYLRFISGEEDPAEIQSEFNRFMDAPLVYISIPDSWDPEGLVTKRLEPITLSQYEIGGNRIFKLKAMAR